MFKIVMVLLISLVQCVYADEDSLEVEKPAMELGGLVTVDFNAPLNEMKKGQLQIGTVNLGATVNVHESITAAIVIAAENDLEKIRIDQAMVSIKPPMLPPVEVLFGQFTFYHGVLATSLISDPLISDVVAIANPGVAINYSFGKIVPGAGFTLLHTDEDSIMGISQSNNPMGLFNCDYLLNDESVVRLSSMMMKSSVDIDLGASVNINRLTVDGEVFSRFLEWKERDAMGYFAGISGKVNGHVSVALRFDGFSDNGLIDNITHRIGAGVTCDIIHGIFAAVEFSHVSPPVDNSYQEIAFQVGLESTLNLPGFQRKTLTNNK